MKGIALTDHATISGHIEATKYIKENEHLKDFKLILGEEFYLCNKEEVEYAVEHNEKVKYPHFLVLAKNENGYKFLKRLTTREWENSFFQRGVQRTPTYYEDLNELIKGYEKDVIFSSACFTKGQKVKTKDEYKNIEDIDSSDVVMTEDGTYQQVIKPTSRNYDGDFIQLDVANSVLPIESTNNHKFLTLPNRYWIGNDKINNDRYEEIKCERNYSSNMSKNKKTVILNRAKQRASYEHPKWTEAKDLKKNEYLLTPIDYTEKNVEVLE